MKIIDQYIYSIGKKLPYKNKKDIKLELHSLIWDDIENTYGMSPTEEQVKKIIKLWGSPNSVANRYRSDKCVIGSGFTDLYFLIIKIMFFAISIAFTVIFIISLFQNEITNTLIATGLENIILNIFNAILPGIGLLTLIFMLITRIYKEEIIDFEEDWTPNDLKDIEIGPKVNSILENVISIFFILVTLIVINAAPVLITIAERAFEFSGVKLGHYVVIQSFQFYLVFLSISWIMEIIHHILMLFAQEKTRNISIYSLITNLVGFIIMIFMVLSQSLYTNSNSLLGFRLIFLIIAIINGIELITMTWSFIKNHILYR